VFSAHELVGSGNRERSDHARVYDTVPRCSRVTNVSPSSSVARHAVPAPLAGNCADARHVAPALGACFAGARPTLIFRFPWNEACSMALFSAMSNNQITGSCATIESLAEIGQELVRQQFSTRTIDARTRWSKLSPTRGRARSFSTRAMLRRR